MKTIAMALGLLFSTTVFGNGLAEISDTHQCTAWVRNAMYGATQSMRGASREVTFISRTRLVELLSPVQGAGRDKLYILAEEGQTQHEREFLEKSILFGYDAMLSWQTYNAGREPGRDEWQQRFMAMCLAYAAI